MVVRTNKKFKRGLDRTQKGGVFGIGFGSEYNNIEEALEKLATIKNKTITRIIFTWSEDKKSSFFRKSSDAQSKLDRFDRFLEKYSQELMEAGNDPQKITALNLNYKLDIAKIKPFSMKKKRNIILCLAYLFIKNANVEVYRINNFTSTLRKINEEKNALKIDQKYTIDKKKEHNTTILNTIIDELLAPVRPQPQPQESAYPKSYEYVILELYLNLRNLQVKEKKFELNATKRQAELFQEEQRLIKNINTQSSGIITENERFTGILNTVRNQYFDVVNKVNTITGIYNGIKDAISRSTDGKANGSQKTDLLNLINNDITNANRDLDLLSRKLNELPKNKDVLTFLQQIFNDSSSKTHEQLISKATNNIRTTLTNINNYCYELLGSTTIATPISPTLRQAPAPPALGQPGQPGRPGQRQILVPVRPAPTPPATQVPAPRPTPALRSASTLTTPTQASQKQGGLSLFRTGIKVAQQALSQQAFSQPPSSPAPPPTSNQFIIQIPDSDEEDETQKTINHIYTQPIQSSSSHQGQQPLEHSSLATNQAQQNYVNLQPTQATSNQTGYVNLNQVANTAQNQAPNPGTPANTPQTNTPANTPANPANQPANQPNPATGGARKSNKSRKSRKSRKNTSRKTKQHRSHKSHHSRRLNKSQKNIKNHKNKSKRRV